MNMYEKQGFDFDPETIDLLDAMLQNLMDDDDLKDEFKKLTFIKKLHNTYDGKPGPLKQLIEKMATMEKEFTRTQLDMQRAVSDLTEAAKTVRRAVLAQTATEKRTAIKKLEGIEMREPFYSWNQRQETNGP